MKSKGAVLKAENSSLFSPENVIHYDIMNTRVLITITKDKRSLSNPCDKIISDYLDSLKGGE